MITPGYHGGDSEVLAYSRDQALYRAIVVYGDLAQYDDIEAKRGENRPCLADDYF